METTKKTIVSLLSLAGITVALCTGQAFGQDDSEWMVDYDSTGQITSLTIKNPQTCLNIEKEIRITTNYAGTPMSGTVTFKTGRLRELEPMEIVVYLEKLNRPRVACDLANSKGYVDAFDSRRHEINDGYLGQPSRIITSSDGKEFQGILLTQDGNPQWLKLKVDDHVVSIYKPVVGRVQQLKAKADERIY